MMRAARNIPRWVLALIMLFGLVEPLTHLWLGHGLPGAARHTGFHIGDTPFFLTAMQLFDADFTSPYVPCAEASESHYAYFALPHHFVYGAIGYLASLLRLDAFLALGLANGLAGMAYLLAAYVFMRAAAPRLANRAFLLFTLGGGLGGALYLGSALLGETGAAGFETWFHRYARYELIEGPFIAPMLVFPRLYYTLPLALGFASLTALLRAVKAGERGPGRPAVILILLTAYLNARLGPMFFLVAMAFIATHKQIPRSVKTRFALCYAAPVAFACALVMLQFRLNPAAAENVGVLLRRSAWFGSLLPLLAWHFFTLPFAIRAHLDALPRWGRDMAFSALGYIEVFAPLYLAHQVYFANLFSGGDTAAAIAVSNVALLGAGVGLAVGMRRKPGAAPEGPPSAESGWLALWLLVFTAIAICALGRDGWFMKFMPERFLLLLGAPLALLSSEGLESIQTRSRIAARALLAAFLVCGACSVLVAALCFQGPLGRDADALPFAWAHSEAMTSADETLIAKLEGAAVLAPVTVPFFGDIIVHRVPGARTVLGQPSLEFGGIDMLEMIRAVQRFFAPDTAPDTAAAFRRAFVERWCVDVIYCPDARPVDAQTLEQLRETPWLEETASAGRAAVFKVSLPTERSEGL